MQIDTQTSDQNTLDSARIVNGSLVLNRRDVSTLTYAVRNSSDMARR